MHSNKPGEAAPGPGPDSHLREETLDSRELLRGNFLHAFTDTVRLPDGRQATREYIRHPGAVMIIAQLDDGKLVLERQFRYPVQSVMLEFPAGKLDAGEGSLACAQRELREETGYTARLWAKAGVLHPVISYSTEFIDIWFARDLTAGQRQLDAGEFLDVFTATPEQVLQWCQDGSVTDGKTLAGALWLQNVLSGAWTRDWKTGVGG
ncbi:MAG TPA: NUDIX hydrolase [Polaromonas sp.]|uniref:NUDIX hydrolase n=1 Tax=Polaromonas sp. TaxID=1869339 RepID=UPI002D229A47|nr:NUDIX hydrolase [Polaromonas sp.]HYW57536.1 NUDIX hydrolase [Polaromonas sp.]